MSSHIKYVKYMPQILFQEVVINQYMKIRLHIILYTRDLQQLQLFVEVVVCVRCIKCNVSLL